MLHVFFRYEDLDADKLMEVYAEGNTENARELYPELPPAAGLRRAEEDFLQFLREEFFTRPGPAYYVLEEDGIWRSALRLNRLEEGLYYLEALETRPEDRRRGFALRLLREVLAALRGRGLPFRLCDCVAKDNRPSLRVHELCGFCIADTVGRSLLTGGTNPWNYSMEYRYDPENENGGTAMDTIEQVLSCISVNTHSSVRIAAEGKVVYVDPFRLPGEPHDADVIFLTHDHFDHFSPEDVSKAMKEDTAFVMPRSTAAAAKELTAGHRVTVVSPEQIRNEDGLVYETVAAYNPGKPFHPKQNGWVGYVLTVLGRRVYIAGDTDDTPEAAGVVCDIALLPIGGKYTMDPCQAAALAKRIRPAAVIPIHYGSVVGTEEAFDRFLAAAGGDVRVERAF